MGELIGERAGEAKVADLDPGDPILRAGNVEPFAGVWVRPGEDVRRGEGIPEGEHGLGVILGGNKAEKEKGAEERQTRTSDELA